MALGYKYNLKICRSIIHNIVISGFDFLNDLKILHASFPYLQPLEKMKNVICMLKLVKSVCYFFRHTSLYNLKNFYFNLSSVMISASNFESNISRLRLLKYDICSLLISVFLIF